MGCFSNSSNNDDGVIETDDSCIHGDAGGNHVGTVHCDIVILLSAIRATVIRDEKEHCNAFCST